MGGLELWVVGCGLWVVGCGLWVVRFEVGGLRDRVACYFFAGYYEYTIII